MFCQNVFIPVIIEQDVYMFKIAITCTLCLLVWEWAFLSTVTAQFCCNV